MQCLPPWLSPAHPPSFQSHRQCAHPLRVHIRSVFTSAPSRMPPPAPTLPTYGCRIINAFWFGPEAFKTGADPRIRKCERSSARLVRRAVLIWRRLGALVSFVSVGLASVALLLCLSVCPSVRLSVCLSVPSFLPSRPHETSFPPPLILGHPRNPCPVLSPPQ